MIFLVVLQLFTLFCLYFTVFYITMHCGAQNKTMDNQTHKCVNCGRTRHPLQSRFNCMPTTDLKVFWARCSPNWGLQPEKTHVPWQCLPEEAEEGHKYAGVTKCHWRPVRLWLSMQNQQEWWNGNWVEGHNPQQWGTYIKKDDVVSWKQMRWPHNSTQKKLENWSSPFQINSVSAS